MNRLLQRAATVLDEEIRKLEEQVSTLVRVCERLREENNGLRVDEKSLTAENAKLAEKARLARVRIEAIIDKLKSLERQG